ncbi:hypothetical protein C8J36_103539 [Rhizobium sp. PP-F2F-G48]|uniref:hypothetical protein n=1 Tax=Rhizobium sp. PP-F2F-G48 TaxID=2135651 RepID=UPI001051EDDE|nr:hypothetical protein [Rhizobium sp. PP-F2F-G48]TCM56169.1 hypothetical protein C8J36_103539 [Rhizobium sp. PP-F2F-G48]
MSYLPTVEILADKQDDAGRASWLLAQPISALLREAMSIRVVLRKAGCQWGVDALDIEVSCAYARRDPRTGELPQALLEARREMRHVLMAIADGVLPPVICRREASE